MYRHVQTMRNFDKALFASFQGKSDLLTSFSDAGTKHFSFLLQVQVTRGRVLLP